jgi:hypothetical protein
VLLVNDFQALGYGLLTVDTSENSKEVVVLQVGQHPLRRTLIERLRLVSVCEAFRLAVIKVSPN